MALGPFDLRFANFCNLMLIGPSGSGKTFLTCKLVLEREKLFKTKPDYCIYFFQDYQDIFNDVKAHDDSVIFVNSIIDFEDALETCGKDSFKMIIFDAFLIKSLYEESKYIINFFLRRTHHQNCATIFQSQLLFPRNLKSLALNTTHFILLKSNNKQQVHYWLRQIDPVNWKAILSAYIECTEEKEYGHFVIDLYQRTPNILKYRDFAIPTESGRVFVPI